MLFDPILGGLAAGSHDDVMTVIGMLGADLMDQPEIGVGSFSNPREVYAQMQAREAAAGGPGTGSNHEGLVPTAAAVVDERNEAENGEHTCPHEGHHVG